GTPPRSHARVRQSGSECGRRGSKSPCPEPPGVSEVSFNQSRGGETRQVGRRRDGFARITTMFVDRVTLFVSGGDGGRGMCSFRREKYVPRGGPNGGDGGNGGNVVVRAVSGADSLAGVVHRKHWRAEKGE